MKIKKIKVKSILLILVQIFIVWQIISIQSNFYRGGFEETTTFNIHKILIRTSQHTDLTGQPIDIDDTVPTKSWAYTAANTDWCSGSGSEFDPYLIDYVYIDGQDFGSCIKISHSTANFTIENCILRNGSYGIYLYNVSNGELNLNNCSFNGYGINIDKCNDIEVVDNYLNNNPGQGIRLDESTFCFVDHNDVNYNGDGIGGGYDVHNNTITYNEVNFNDWEGIEINGDENDIQHNTVNYNNYGGIHCWGDKNDISYNDANYNEGYGIYAGFESVIIQNTVNFNSESGIYVYSANCTISNNNANYNKEAGIYLSDEGHDLVGNQLDGCGLYIAQDDQETMSSYTIATSNIANSKIIYYKIDTNDLRSTDFTLAAQIFLVNCNNSIIRNFVLNNVSIGISMHFSNNNSISENTLNYNSLQGISIRGEKNNITDNSIMNGGSITVIGGNCRVLLNDISNGGGISVSGNYNNVSENTVNFGNGMTISGDHAIVLSNTIYDSSSTGIHIYDNYATIVGNNINYCNQKGIYIRCSHSEISGNTINNCLEEGIYIYNADNNTIAGNSINNNLNGIFLTYSGDQNNISKNTLTNNKEYGIYMSTWSTYEHNNTITENKMYGCGFGIEPRNLNHLITNDTIESTNLVNNKPLYFYYDKVNLDGSNFTNAGQIFLIDCSNSILENFNFNNGSVGITLYYCDNIDISDVTSENNKLYGIYLYYTDNTVISNSNLNYNTEYGIYFDTCEDNIITENTIGDTEKDGLYMYSCSDINSTSNSFVNNQFGITLYYDCTENYFEMNTIHNNTDFGLRILYTTCDYNEFYENSFINPAGINACDNGSAHNYYYGNYWHDYPGKDANDDGIGDTPYSIDGSANSQDEAPNWWDPPVLTVDAPLEDGSYRNAPFYVITIDEGIADSIWYMLNNTEKIFISQLNGSIEQNAWNQLRDGNVKITFFANDSRGFINYVEVNVIKTSESEFPIELIILITSLSIGAAVGIGIAIFYFKRIKGSKD